MAQAAGPLAVGAGIVKGIGQLAQGAGDAAAYQSNSRQALQQAEVERQASYLQAGDVERKGAEVVGAQRAGFGAAGVAPSLWVLSDTAHRAEMQRQAALFEGRSKAAAQLRESDIQHAKATEARTGSYIGAAGTVLGSIAQAAAA